MNENSIPRNSSSNESICRSQTKIFCIDFTYYSGIYVPKNNLFFYLGFGIYVKIVHFVGGLLKEFWFLKAVSF